MLSYDQFVNDLNTGSLVECEFEIEGYSHYKEYKIMRIEDTLGSGEKVLLIVAQLTKDKTEYVSSLDCFDESYKLFRMGRRGTFT